MFQRGLFSLVYHYHYHYYHYYYYYYYSNHNFIDMSVWGMMFIIQCVYNIYVTYIIMYFVQVINNNNS